MNRLAQSHLDFELDAHESSNTWIALLLVAIIVAMLLVFVAFDQQSKWWFGAVVNDLYATSDYQVHIDSAGNLIYLLGAGCFAAVAIGFNLLRAPLIAVENEKPRCCSTTHPESLLSQCADKRMMAHFNQYDHDIENHKICDSKQQRSIATSATNWHMFNMINPKLRNLLNPTGQGQRSVFIYLDGNIDDEHVNLQREIHGYFAHHGKSIRLLAPPQILSGQSALSLESQVNRIHQHVVNQHLDNNSQILVIGDGKMADTISTVCRRYQNDVKLLQISYH